MKIVSFCKSGIIFPLLIFILSSGCADHHRQIVPCEVDSDELFKALEPNEESDPENPTFGKNNLPGFIFDYDLTTENSSVFIYYQNVTVLDVNPKINQSIFEFIQQQLSEGGFNNDSVSLSPDEYVSLQKSGLSFQEVAAKIIEKQKENFETEFDTIKSFQSPFNIYFQVYPIYLNDKYVTYREYSYSYTGGAHGITVAYIKSFDLSSGEEVTLDQIVKPNELTTIHEEVAAHMAYSYPIYENITTVEQYIDSLNVWLDTDSEENYSQPDKITIENYPLPNPGITKEGLAFMYQMYSMAPGSDGCPIVVIPYHDIKGCLNITIDN